jgi:hypothetical protein
MWVFQCIDRLSLLEIGLYRLVGQTHIYLERKPCVTRGLDYEHMIKARAHKGGVRIGKTPKKLASICCP